jgi:hypothetical protein
MNHLGRFGKGTDMVLKQAIENFRRRQTDSIIKSIYRRYKDNPMIRWKTEIKKIVGIPMIRQNGVDIKIVPFIIISLLSSTGLIV